jgi:hypothetical protein
MTFSKVSVPIDPDDKEELARAAEEDGLTISELVSELIAIHLHKRRAAQPKRTRKSSAYRGHMTTFEYTEEERADWDKFEKICKLMTSSNLNEADTAKQNALAFLEKRSLDGCDIPRHIKRHLSYLYPQTFNKRRTTNFLEGVR